MLFVSTFGARILALEIAMSQINQREDNPYRIQPNLWALIEKLTRLRLPTDQKFS